MQDNNELNISPQFLAEAFTLESMGEEAKQLAMKNEAANQSSSTGLFTIKPANEWLSQAKLRPAAKMLFGEFWFEGELCILFSDTNMGKSILAVQIGDSLSKGVNIPGFKLEAAKQKVLYFDFELSDKQFEHRYSIDSINHYSFSENFIRIEISQDAEVPKGNTFEGFLSDSLEKAIIDTGANVLIIDNITYLKNENEKAKDALPLMKHLKGLKRKYGISILCLSHTPKRDFSKPLTKNDLQGSKMLINFCDSSFAIGESQQDKHLRYLKQIKQRNVGDVYDEGNICVCQITKPHNFLHFEFVCYGNEREHLAQPNEKGLAEQTQRVLEFHKQGCSLREIGRKLQLSHTQVSRIIKNNSNSQ